MPTSSDLAQAASFTRSRLVHAFVSGVVDARETEPTRSGRAVVGGLALAVLLGAGAAIAHVLAPHPPDDWTSPGLILAEETGQAYVILPDDDDGAGRPPADGARVELHPVTDLTSARLILGEAADPVLVPQEAIDEQSIGGDVGIPGAPASLPAPGALVETGWTACTAGDRGTRVRVTTEPAAPPLPGAAVVVGAGRSFYLVVSEQVGDDPPSAYALQLPAGDAVDNMLGALGLPARASAPRVPRAWVDLFPAGAPVDRQAVDVAHVGARPGQWDAAGVPRGVRVGDVVEDAAGDAVVMTAEGPADLDPFARAVYTGSSAPGLGAPRVFVTDRLPDLTRTRLPLTDAHWPIELPRLLPADPCAVLVTAPGAPAAVELAASPGDGYAADDVRPGRVEVEVDPGHGALVLAPGAEPEPVLIDATGRAHPLEGGETLTRLGYPDQPTPVVPSAWLDLFRPGVPLSRERALCGRVSCG